MPEVDVDVKLHEFPMSKRGINIYSNILTLHPEECIFSQNTIWKNGMVKRGGQTLDFNNTEAVAGNKTTGLHRFYFGTSKQRLVASETKVVKDDEDNTWTDVYTGMTDGLEVFFTTWGALGKAYISNGTDTEKSWDGSSLADMGTTTDWTSPPLMMLPYQDRLFGIVNTATAGTLEWTNSFDDAIVNVAENTGVQPDTRLYGMIIHSLTDTDTGYRSSILLAGANGMYLFQGTNMRVPATEGDYTIYPLATNVGCNAPRTMTWTPAGSMWLGIDRQVYLLPFENSQPIPVGTKIQSNVQGVNGIESIPVGQIATACAVYHDGFYKLSISKPGGTNNSTQWWLDVKRLQQDEDRLFGPWFGPMEGQTINVFALQAGPGDGGELIGGESTAKSYIYDLHKQGDTGDINPSDASIKAIQLFWQSYYHPLGNIDFNKVVHRIEAELLDVLGTVNIDFHDITGSIETGDSFGLSGSAEFYNDNFYDEEYYSSSIPTRQVVTISPAINTRRLSVIIKHNISNDTFELYSVKAEALEQRKVFEGANVS